MTAECAAVGCDRPAMKATKLCARCGNLPGPLGAPARIWAQVNFTATGCWNWTGNTLRNGYGQVCIDGRTWLLHRYIHQLANGPIGADLTVDHLCFNKACMNPAHLEAVSARTNVVRARVLAKTKTSRFLGVSKKATDRRWLAQVRRGKPCVWSGYFDSELDAALAYDDAVRRLIDPEGCTNASLGLLDEHLVAVP